jgi:hypothetical protein
MELGERQITISMIEGLADALGLDYRELQIKFVTEKIMQDFKGQPFLKEALLETMKFIKE